MNSSKTIYSFLVQLSFLGFILISIGNAHAGALPDGDQERSRALEFRFGPNFTVGNLNGSALSMKWGVSANRAYRIGISFESGLNFGSTETSENEILDTSEYDLFLRLHTERIYYFPTESRVALYFGYGPRLGYGFDQSEESTNDSSNLERQTTQSIEAGIGALVGVEWQVTRSLSLSGEYGINTTYAITTQNTRTHDIQRRNQTQRTLQLAGTLVRLRIAVYF